MRCALFVLVALSALAMPAGAADLCPDRPGNATPPCIVDQGHLQVETGIIDWTHDRRDGVASDGIAYAATELRYGLTSTLEVELGWSPFNTSTVTDHHSGVRQHAQGVGDVTFSLRQSLANPDGKGVSVAIQPFVTAPTGRSGIGTDGWSGGVLLPFAAEIGGGFTLGGTPEIDWSADNGGGGHHATYTGVVSLSHPLGGAQAGVEFWASRDDDPAGAKTQATADLTLAWTPKASPDMQFDAGLNAGLNSSTPRAELYVGVTRRF